MRAIKVFIVEAKKTRKKKLDAKRKAAEESVEGSGKAAEKRGKGVADKVQKPVIAIPIVI